MSPQPLVSSPTRRFARMLRPHKTRVAAAAVALVAAAAFSLAAPWTIGRMIDQGLLKHDVLDRQFLILLALTLGLGIASAARSYCVSWIGERLAIDIRRDVFNRLMRIPLALHDKYRAGELLSRVASDVAQIKAMFGASASIALRNAVMLIGAIALMILTAPDLAAQTAAAIPLVVLPLVVFGRKVRRLSRKAQDALAEGAALAQERIAAIDAVKVFRREDHASKLFADAGEEAFQAARLRMAAGAVLAMLAVIAGLGGVAVVLWSGARDVVDGNLSGGQLAQFVLYALLAAGALAELSQVWSDIQTAAGAAERLAELLNLPQEDGDHDEHNEHNEHRNDAAPAAPAAPVAARSPPPSIVVADATFRYPERPDVEAVSRVSFEIARGETVALVGPSGSGKSTLLKLLTRLYDLDHGRIEIDGVDVSTESRRRTRARFAYAPQEAPLFSGSVLDNILFARPEAGEEAARSAARAADAEGFVLDLPHGYHEPTGEDGALLSVGQRHRLALARTLLASGSIVLLDEPSAALDAASEERLRRALRERLAGRSAVMASHRLASARDADRILVLDAGRLVEQGTHDELISADGLYAWLVRMQEGRSRPSPAKRAKP